MSTIKLLSDGESEPITEYKINIRGFYALYKPKGSNTPWRESASITNTQLRENNRAQKQ